MYTKDFFNHLTAVYRPYIKLLQPIFDEFEVYPAQWLVLKDLAYNGPTTLVQISKRRAIEKPTTRKILKILSEKSLLTIEQGIDKREKILTLSEDGKILFDNITQRIETLQDDIVKHTNLSSSQLDEAITTIQSIHEQISKMEEA
ncbi:MarR family transcriptional regulator [Staphylococcus succinus]|uniref:MarR family transcriptional regulator n=1 Tax=Staphylococcus succinus TaxID=61015 RepID=A0ABX5ILC2_9STAP|nr:MarR family transcriptional regulator [Staphylococcus succinus]MBU0438165.1 MarR family transcriptional regulator [Staphylococcus succinus]MEB7462408.1 MarR family transcriptional regulator [Staphylococcus succinus]PKI21824.1 MarR family transcriptional regulator [Staphylococcus succinus]PTI48229.1 MarR family transcriptional regulator [Staphylococcus succinus]PTI67160.1 MarR family transcriptional regulator [Staphylococcus succinus]